VVAHISTPPPRPALVADGLQACIHRQVLFVGASV
jgi:hypothetical protein